MGRDRAWMKAAEASQVAKELFVRGSAKSSMFGKTDSNLEIYFLLALIADSIKELTIPEGPIRLSDLQIGDKGEWWK